MRNKTSWQAIKSHLKVLRRSQVVDHVEGWQRLNEGDEEGGQVSSKRVVILAAPADMNYDLGTKVSYKKYLKLAR